MEPVAPASSSHPLVAALDAVSAAIDAAFAIAEWTQDAGTTAATTKQLVTLESRLSALKLRNLAHAESVQVHQDGGASSTANWFGHLTRTSRREAHAQTRLAVALVEDRPVRAPLADGPLQVEQAQAIVHAVDQLPDEIDAELRRKAEAYLVEQADLHDAKALRLLGLRLMEVIAPDEADAHQAKKLEAEERRAAETTRLTLTEDGGGSVFVRGKLPALHGAMLKKALFAYAAPKHQAAVTGQVPPRRPTAQRLGQAFCELLESLQDKDLPTSGGTGATVVVTMSLETLLGGLKAAHLDTGEPISPGEARRLACRAGIIPAVLGGPSVPLDLGRRRRFHTRHQRIALALRDRGCVAEGCDAPPALTQSHHLDRWTDGGPTDLDNSTLLCSPHHHRIHDATYQTTRLPTGKITVHRRT